jgi:hypothetical protein
MAAALHKNNPPNPVLGGKEGIRRVFETDLSVQSFKCFGIHYVAELLHNVFRALMAFRRYTPISMGYPFVHFCNINL